MAEQAEVSSKGTARYRKLNWRWRAVLFIFTASSLILAINQIFMIRTILENAYLYWLMALFLPLVFILFPATLKSPRNKVAWYDILLFFITFGICLYFAFSAWDILHKGWVFEAPLLISIVSAIFSIIVLEAVRRTGGKALLAFAFLFAIYPLFASRMPGFMEGGSFPFWSVIRYHVLSTDSILGIPMQTTGNLILGFMVFGVVLAATGGGEFFLSFATALFGTHRGGPAKVSVVASGFFGTMSGSVMSNVITTGSITIPTMKRAGYPPHYAAAVEACASTGGCFMPPVMGAVGFVMASVLNIPYMQVAAAAFLPAILYYIALFWQVDAFAGRGGLKGLDKSQIPRLLPTLKQGWPYIFAFAVLVYFLFLRREAQSPFFATALLIAIAVTKKETRHNLKEFFGRLGEDSGKILVELTAILAGCGFILGGLTMTGVGSSLAHELVDAAGGIPLLMLVFGAIASYILGMGMTVTATYILLAIILAPGLTSLGFDPLAIHLFMVYWGLTSFITPPVALGSYTAAGIAGASAIKTGFTAMRLGIIIYIVPFFFVYDPSLVLRGSPLETIQSFFTAALGIIPIAAGLEGYLIGFGKLPIALRILVFVPGILLAMPGWRTDVAGALILAIVLGTVWIKRKAMSRAPKVSLNSLGP